MGLDEEEIGRGESSAWDNYVEDMIFEYAVPAVWKTGNKTAD